MSEVKEATKELGIKNQKFDLHKFNVRTFNELQILEILNSIKK